MLDSKYSEALVEQGIVLTESNQPEKNSPSISLCICTMNRPEDLDRCLASVFAGSSVPDEVIVSDDSSNSEPTRLVVAKYPGVLFQEGPRRGLGPNRNACIQRAKGSYIIFIDDDVLVPSDFFATAQRLIYSCDSQTIITGYEMNYGGGGRWQGEVKKVVPQNPDFWGYQHVPIVGDYCAIVINSTIFPSQLFDQALFDENLRYGSEEIDIAQHALALGYQIIYEDCLYVEHHPSPVNREKYRQFIHASRMYATTKAYWQYERSPLKTLTYMVFAPIQLSGSAIRRGNLSALFSSFQSAFLAASYLMRNMRLTLCNQK
jgi:glycosyltransferase involved in cell wall biosynthesis